MKKIVKIAAIVVAVLLVILLVAPMMLRGKIADIVKREANEMLVARLDFDKLDISLLRHFPHASLDLKNLTLTGTGRFEGDTIVAAQRISVVVDLMSLFGDSGFEVSKVILSSPSVHARKLADGAVNWDVMKPSDAAEEVAGEPEDASSAQEEPSSFRLSVRDFRISDAAIRYEDDSTGMYFSTDPLSLRLKGDLSAQHTTLDLNLSAKALHLVSGGIPMLSGAESEFDARIDADLANGRYTLSNNTLRLNAIKLGLDGWVETHDDGLSLDLTAGCDKVEFKDVLSLIPAFYTREFKNLTAGGALSMSVWARGDVTDTTLPAFEVKVAVDNGSFQYASLPKAVTGINIDASVSNPGGTMDQTEIRLPRFELQMAGNSVSATFQAKRLVSDPTFSLSAAGRVDLGAVKEVYPLDEGINLDGEISANLQVSGCMSDIEKGRYEAIGAKGTFVIEGVDLSLEALPQVSIRRAAATITPSAMTLGEFGVKVGRSDLSATGQLSNYIGYLLRGDVLSGRLYVKSELLDLNEIMAASSSEDASAEAQASEPADEAESGAEAVAAAIEVPRNLNLSLSAELKRILFGKMDIGNVAGELRMADGALWLEGLTADVFGGKVSTTGCYSTAADPSHPTFDLNASLAKASFQQSFEQLEVIQQLVPIFAKTGGDYSMTLNLSTTLDAGMSPDLQTLNATGELRSENINIQNIAAFEALATALNNDNLRKIQAKDVAVRFAVRDGRVHTEPFDLKVGDVSTTLSGSTGLDQTIDYTARVTIPGGQALQTLNVNIGGTFTDPKITLGVKEAVQEAVKNVVDDQIQKLTGSESLSDEIAKQAENLRAQAKSAGEKLVAEAQKQRDKLVEEASKKGALAKLAAQKAGDKLVEEAQKQAANLEAEAEKQIEKLTAPKE